MIPGTRVLFWKKENERLVYKMWKIITMNIDFTMLLSEALIF